MPIGRFVTRSESSDSIADAGPDKQGAQELRWSLERPRFRLQDMILSEDTYQQISDVISFFHNRDRIFHAWGLSEKFEEKAGLAVNLYGPPGTGKTMAAHAIANELNLQMICVNYAEIESKYVGETSKNLDALFKSASELGAMIFFDEADALLSKRVTNMTSATDVSVNQTRSVLLTLLNDYDGVILFATNFIQNFDAAFLRRIAYHIEFHLPDAKCRELLWRSYIPEKMPCSVDYFDLASKYTDISGSDISNAVFTAAVSAARANEAIVDQRYFEDAIEHIQAVKDRNRGEIEVTERVISDEEYDLIVGNMRR